MKRAVFVNPFVVMKFEKRVRTTKGKQAFLQHVKQLRLEQRKLQDTVNVVTTIY